MMGKKHKGLKKVKGQSNVSMSLYEINQNIIGQLSPLTEEQLAELSKKLNDWRVINYPENVYFMLLCNDIHYYTILNKVEPVGLTDFYDLGEAVLKLAEEAGYQIISEDGYEDRYEIWLKNDEGTYDFILFPYDMGVVTFGK